MEYVNTELAEANKYQRKSRKKYVVCFLLLLAILVAVLFSFLI
jgi:t-SNARE complex subunit (syntaxin)